MLADSVHRIGNPDEVLDELVRDLLVHGVVFGQDEGYLQHALAVERHPRGTVRLLQMTAGRQGTRAVEDADVVEPEEAALEHVVAVGVLAIDPPGKRDQQFVEGGFEKSAIAFAGLFFFDLVDTPHRPTDHGRINVAVIPFVGRDLAVGVLVPLAQDDIELALREMRIDQRQRDAGRGGVARGVEHGARAQEEEKSYIIPALEIVTFDALLSRSDGRCPSAFS